MKLTYEQRQVQQRMEKLITTLPLNKQRLELAHKRFELAVSENNMEEAEKVRSELHDHLDILLDTMVEIHAVQKAALESLPPHLRATLQLIISKSQS